MAINEVSLVRGVRRLVLRCGSVDVSRYALITAMILALPALTPFQQGNAASEPPSRIVILNPGDPYMPAVLALDQALREAVRARHAGRVEFYSETLDVHRFPRRDLEQGMRALLHEKYDEIEIDVVVAVDGTPLDFAERYGNEIWPGAPIVFHSVPLSFLENRRLGPRTTGSVVRYELEIENLVRFALQVRPGTRRIVLVAGSGDFDRRLVSLAGPTLETLAQSHQVELLVDRSLADTQAELAELPPDATVLFLTMGQDGNGAPHISRDAMTALADASSAPIFSIFETYLDHGVVAGPMVSFAERGRRAGAVVARVLDGEEPAALGVQPAVPSGCIADWRELRRWNIDESLLPDDCDVRFREETVWERYWWQITVAGVVILAQAALIAALLAARYRQRRAELAVQRLRVELTHAGRLATMGEITANVAHEVRQPLSAIFSNAEAAEMLLEAGPENLDEVRGILADIRKDDERANEIIKRLRALLGKQEVHTEPIDLNSTIDEVVLVLESEARARRVQIVRRFDQSLPPAQGDRVHVQQVVLNLLVNAMDAMADLPPGRRRVTVRTALHDDAHAEVAVADRGRGVAPDDLPRLFESFYTTKEHGMGIGLSISRTIIEALGGRIWADAGSTGGATFRFTLPVVGSPPGDVAAR